MKINSDQPVKEQCIDVNIDNPNKESKVNTSRID